MTEGVFGDELRLLQLYSAGLISRQTFLEKSQIVDDPEEELKRIRSEEAERRD